MDTDALLASLPARISAIVRRWAARTPDAPALREGERTLSYAQLAFEMDRHATLLRELGVRAGDRVMVVAENSVAQIALIFAAADLDAWIVNVNARLSAAEIEIIRVHSGARRVITVTNGQLAIGPLNEADPEPVEAGNEQVAALLYTTGTTGHPKGVMLTHRNLLFIAAVSSTLRGLTPNDRAYGVLPISHVYGLASVMLGTLYAGACLYLQPRFTAQAFLDAVRRDGLTIAQGVPAMYARLLELAKKPLSHKLRFLYAGGSPLDLQLKRQVEELFGIPLHNGYGMTESSPTISQTRLDAPRADDSVGMPIPGIEVRIAEGGELWVRGPNVTKGYYREPELTAAALRDGWLNTGDMARQDADGALFITGRTKELIIRSGFNVYPLEVEAALNSHPAVAQSAVIGRVVDAGNEEVIAFVELVKDALTTDHELQEHLATRLAPYKRPSHIVIMAALPAAATGKILKSRLHALAKNINEGDTQ